MLLTLFGDLLVCFGFNILLWFGLTAFVGLMVADFDWFAIYLRVFYGLCCVCCLFVSSLLVINCWEFAWLFVFGICVVIVCCGLLFSSFACDLIDCFVCF